MKSSFKSFMKEQYPERYSDSQSIQVTKLDKDLFAFSLDTLGRGIAPESLRSWIKKYDEGARPLDINERERLRPAEIEVKRLKEENEILIKAAAFFTQETTRRK